MKMKKVLSAALSVIMVITSLSACGVQKNDARDDGRGGDKSEAESMIEGSDGLSYQTYAEADKYVAASDAAKYDGSDTWPTVTWSFDCATGEPSTWAQAGYYFNALMQESTDGNVKVNVYPGSKQTEGDQIAAIQNVMDGDHIQVSLNSNLIYANYDEKFNVVSLPYLFSGYEDVDKAMSGSGGQALKDVLASYGLVCEGIGENGFRQITNSKIPVTKAEDLKSVKMRICANDMLAELYREWGCNATILDWDETSSALKDGIVDGQENPETTIDSESIQEVQDYISLWNAYYDCLFFCINQKAYDKFTDSQKAVIDANAARTVEYQKTINREQVSQLVDKWKNGGDLQVTSGDQIDSDSFREASAGIYDWYLNKLITKGMSEADAKSYVADFRAS